jgi:hypothetical protein
MPYFFGFQRFNSARSASMPAASIFAQVAGVSRTVRCTRCSSGGFGGLPRGRFSSSMPRTVAPIYEDSNNPCNPDLCDYNKYMETDTSTRLEWTVRPAWTRGRNGNPKRCGWHLMHGTEWAQTFSRKRDAQREAARNNSAGSRDAH